MQPQIIKAVLAQALLFGIKDAIHSFVVAMLISLAKVSGRNVGVKA